MKLTALLVLVMGAILCNAQKMDEAKIKNYRDLPWSQVALGMPDDWYVTIEAKMAADSILKYQTEIGGWPKNYNYHTGVNQKEWASIKSTGIGATFDNGATLTEMKFLVRMYNGVKDERYKYAFNKAFNYILSAQYANGGWPQFYPIRPGRGVSYNSHITYNDDVMVNIMTFLRDIVEDKPFYSAMQISHKMKQKAKLALDMGVDCVLKTQIMVNGNPTVWCAQHDEITLAPADARAYELASFSGAESVNIVLFLMDIKNPSQEIIRSVNGAVNWFQNHKIEGIKLQQISNSDGLKDLIVIEDKNAGPLWARFYDLDTELPFFCDRDGIKRKSFVEMGYNRRNGYRWYTTAPTKLFQKYPSWVKENNVN